FTVNSTIPAGSATQVHFRPVLLTMRAPVPAFRISAFKSADSPTLMAAVGGDMTDVEELEERSTTSVITGSQARLATSGIVQSRLMYVLLWLSAQPAYSRPVVLALRQRYATS